MLCKHRQKNAKNVTKIFEKGSVSKVYLRFERMKRYEDRKGSFWIVTSYAVDTLFQDINIHDTVSDFCDSVLSLRDNLECGLSASRNVRLVVRHQQQTAMLKLVYLMYKIIVYKCVLMQMIGKDDIFIRMSVDYLHLILDKIML